MLEQGARAACVAGRFSNAYEARNLEAALCAQPQILETMRASVKARLLAEEPYNPAEACEVLESKVSSLIQIDEVIQAGFSPKGAAQDLSHYYFGGPSPDVSELQLPNGHENECAGECLGMVGDKLVMRQGNFGYVVSLKEWVAHAIDLLEGEIGFEYESAPQQISLF